MADKTGLYVVIIGFIAVVVGLAFWSTVGGSIGTLTIIGTSTNASFTLPANGTTADLTTCGQLNTSSIVIFNATNGTVGFQNHIIPASNYTISQAAGTDGFLSARIVLTNLFNGGGYYGQSSNVTCTYQPRGYVAEGGTRAIVVIIPIFLALAIAFAASPDLRNWLKGVVSS